MIEVIACVVVVLVCVPHIAWGLGCIIKQQRNRDSLPIKDADLGQLFDDMWAERMKPTQLELDCRRDGIPYIKLAK